jgi:hypothetical protein
MPKKSLRTQLAAALPFLQALSRMSDVERASALEFINDDGLAVLQQCIYNCIYNQNIPRKKAQRFAAHLERRERSTNT